MVSLKDFFLDLNIFESSPTDNNQRQDANQRYLYIIASRIYFIILISVLIIVASISLLIRQTTVIKIDNPTKDQFLDLPYDANCPCTQISIPYEEFTSIQPNFHEICSSDFVTNRWIDTLSSNSNADYYYLQDFRRYGSAQFQALAAFCRLSVTDVEREITAYGRNTLISSKVLSQPMFSSMVAVSMQQFLFKISNESKIQLQLIREMFMSNRLISGLQTNNRFIYEKTVNDLIKLRVYSIHYQLDNKSTCNCMTDLDCISVSGLFNISDTANQFDLNSNLTWIKIPGIVSGCLPVDSILLSTLECFYNQTCIDHLLAFFSTTEKFTALDNNKPSRFSSYSTVQSIVDRLMIESWMYNNSYEAYYLNCAPISCIYTKLERNNVVSVLTQLIGILGGLTILLGFIIPIPIRSLQQPLPNTQQSDSTSLKVHLLQMKTMVVEFILKLNWFTHQPSNDRQITYQKYATRLYILLVIASLITMIVYISLGETVYAKTVDNPTESQYEELERDHPESLSCPCTSISVSYSNFISIQPSYHQLCSSDFVSSSWLNYLAMNLNWEDQLLPEDYRILSISLFKYLSMFCQESKQIIDNSLNIFLQREFIGLTIVSQQLFQIQIESFIQNWQTTILKQYLHIIEFIRRILHGNQLMNNINIVSGLLHSNCSCTLSSSCPINMAIYQSTELYRIPNFFLDCLPIEGLFVSTLECFYNRSCMMEIDKYMYQSLGETFYFSPLDKNLNRPDELIESIVNRLMIETWSINISFSLYYNQCAPRSCTYVYNSRKSLYSILMIIVGVFGGLSLAFRMIILFILRFIESIILFRRDFLPSIKNSFDYRNEQRLIKQLHFIFVVISLSIVYIYAAFTPKLVTVVIANPSLNVFQTLVRFYPATLECPCSRISIQYQSFTSITPYFHQVCSSDFVSDKWMKHLYVNDDDPMHRSILVGQFQLLASLCQLSQIFVNDSLVNLLTNDLINTNSLPEDVLYAYTAKIQISFEDIISKSFLTTFSLLRETIGTNMLMTTSFSNWIIINSSDINNQSIAHTVPVSYQECSCALSSKCILFSENISIGCYPLEVLLQTTFACLYNQECIDSSNTFQALDITQPTRYDINTTIELIVNELMIEQFPIQISYSNYFNQCSPSLCQYSYIEPRNTMDGITNLISLYGGLMVICRAVAVIIVKLLKYRKQRIDSISAS